MCKTRSLLLLTLLGVLDGACKSVQLEPDPGAGGQGGSGGTIIIADGGASGYGGLGGEGGIAGSGGNDMPGPESARRLSSLEYRNTLRDLLGYAIPPTSLGGLPPDFEGSQSGYPAGFPVDTSNDVDTLMNVAELAAASAMKRLDVLLPASCATPADRAAEDTCAFAFIETFGLRAFRRPLSSDEISPLKQLYGIERGADIGGSFGDGIRVLITAMLQAPPFLYRWELNQPPTRDGKLVRFNAYEVASRLSYFLWASMPDATLLTAATDGKLGTPDEIATQAQRLLADPRAADSLAEFHAWWLGYVDLLDDQKDPSFSLYTPQLAQSMLNESRAFVVNLFQGQGATGKLETLLTSTTSFIDGDLAILYGLDSPGPLHQAALLPTQRAGILTQGSFLASQAEPDRPSPGMRGEAILDRLLCVNIFLPANVVIPPVTYPPPAHTTNRQSVETTVSDPCASACHMVYQIGYAFENYDTIGAYRTNDGDQPVDATGTVMLPVGDDLQFHDALDLTHKLADRDDVRDCVSRQWLRYLTRRMEGDGEAPSLKTAKDAFRNSAYDLRALVVALTKTRAFTHRSPSVGEVLP